MQHVLTLVAGAEAGGIEISTLGAVRSALAALGARVGEERWLAADLAADLPFDSVAWQHAETAARTALGAAPLDLLAQESGGRQKRLLVADMDSTIVGVETLDEVADFAGLKVQVAAITERSMRGEIDFTAALEERVAMLAGLSEEALEGAWQRVFLVPGAAALVGTMRKAGAYTALVSGGFRFFSRRVRERLGFDYDEANELEIVDHRLSGRVVPPVIDRHGKHATLTRLAAARGIPLSATLAVGDGANDLEMIAAAGLGVAYRGKPAVAAAARARVDHGDLTALLYFQGYRREEFAG